MCLYASGACVNMTFIMDVAIFVYFYFQEGLGSSSISNNLSRKQAKLDLHMEAQALSSGVSCCAHT